MLSAAWPAVTSAVAASFPILELRENSGGGGCSGAFAGRDRAGQRIVLCRRAFLRIKVRSACGGTAEWAADGSSNW